MVEALVLKLPNFNELFIIETDASHSGIRAVLQQEDIYKELLHLKWFPKHMGFDYDILYKNGSENKAVDASSRIPTTDAELQKIITNLEDNPQSHKHYSWTNGQLRRKGKLVVGNNELRQQLLQYFHLDPSGGHSGVQATIKRITRLCYWRKLRQQVKVFMAICKANLVEYWYNTTYHTSIKTTPYEVLYGQPPSNPIAYIQAQKRMKIIADAKRTDRDFKVDSQKGGAGWLSFGLANYISYSSTFLYLTIKGPIPNATAHIPQCNEEGEILSVPVEVFDRRSGKVRNTAQVFVLIKWSNGTVDD
ncbi:reverse transcriptase [Tanacetum coccineum]